MKTIRLCTLGLLALLLAACAPTMAELPQPSARLEMYGYSFTPPDETGWKVAGRRGQQVVLGRRGTGRDETVMIMAGNAAIPRFDSNAEFEAFVRKQMQRDAGPGERFGVRQQELTMLRHEGADCVRSHLVSVDRQARKRSGWEGDMVLEIMQLFCRHPEHDGTLTYLGYSQRTYPEARDPHFADKAKRLFDSLRFTAF